MKCIKSLKEQLESVIKNNQELLEKWHKNNDKIINLISENERLKEIVVENGVIVNPKNDYEIARLKAIRMKCKELLKLFSSL